MDNFKSSITQEIVFSNMIFDNAVKLGIYEILAVLTYDNDDSDIEKGIIIYRDNHNSEYLFNISDNKIFPIPRNGDFEIIQSLNNYLSEFTYSDKWTAIGKVSLVWNIFDDISIYLRGFAKYMLKRKLAL